MTRLSWKPVVPAAKFVKLAGGINEWAAIQNKDERTNYYWDCGSAIYETLITPCVVGLLQPLNTNVPAPSIIASSQYQGQAAAFVGDGNNASFWANNNEANSKLVIDFGQANMKKVSRLDIVRIDIPGWDARSSPNQMSIKYFLGGVSSIHPDTVTRPNAYGTFSHVFSHPFFMDKIEITFTSNHNINSNWIAINELYLYS